MSVNKSVEVSQEYHLENMINEYHFKTNKKKIIVKWLIYSIDYVMYILNAIKNDW